MVESAWNDHIRYLEDEVNKMGERAEKTRGDDSQGGRGAEETRFAETCDSITR